MLFCGQWIAALTGDGQWIMDKMHWWAGCGYS